MKARYNKGESANLYFYRDSNNNEVDLLARDRKKALRFDRIDSIFQA